jgi:hypothetical protein
MYVGLILNRHSKNLLLDLLGRYFPSELSQKDVTKMLCHHITITMGSGSKGLYGWAIGEQATAKVVAIGYTEKAIAFKVELPEGKGINPKRKGRFKEFDPIPHITAATLNGASPVESQAIVNWTDIKSDTIEEYEVGGVVQVVD